MWIAWKWTNRNSPVYRSLLFSLTRFSVRRCKYRYGKYSSSSSWTDFETFRCFRRFFVVHSNDSRFHFSSSFLNYSSFNEPTIGRVSFSYFDVTNAFSISVQFRGFPSDNEKFFSYFMSAASGTKTPINTSVEEKSNGRSKAKGRNNESPNKDLANFTELYNSDVN